MGWSHTHMQPLEIRRDIWLLRSFLRSDRSHPHTRIPIPRFQCWKAESPQHATVKISGDSNIQVRWMVAKNPDVLQKNSPTDRPIPRHSLWAQVKDGSSGVSRDLQRSSDLCGFRARARRTAAIVSVFSFPPMQHTGECHLSYLEPHPLPSQT